MEAAMLQDRAPVGASVVVAQAATPPSPASERVTVAIRAETSPWKSSDNTVASDNDTATPSQVQPPTPCKMASMQVLRRFGTFGTCLVYYGSILLALRPVCGSRSDGLAMRRGHTSLIGAALEALSTRDELGRFLGKEANLVLGHNRETAEATQKVKSKARAGEKQETSKCSALDEASKAEGNEDDTVEPLCESCEECVKARGMWCPEGERPTAKNNSQCLAGYATCESVMISDATRCPHGQEQPSEKSVNFSCHVCLSETSAMWCSSSKDCHLLGVASCSGVVLHDIQLCPDAPKLNNSGWELIDGFDTFPNEHAARLLAIDTVSQREVKKMCEERSYGAFVIYKGIAYLKARTALEVRKNLIEAAGRKTYVRREFEEKVGYSVSAPEGMGTAGSTEEYAESKTEIKETDPVEKHKKLAAVTGSGGFVFDSNTGEFHMKVAAPNEVRRWLKHVEGVKASVYVRREWEQMDWYGVTETAIQPTTTVHDVHDIDQIMVDAFNGNCGGFLVFQGTAHLYCSAKPSDVRSNLFNSHSTVYIRREWEQNDGLEVTSEINDDDEIIELNGEGIEKVKIRALENKCGGFLVSDGKAYLKKGNASEGPPATTTTTTSIGNTTKEPCVPVVKPGPSTTPTPHDDNAKKGEDAKQTIVDENSSENKPRNVSHDTWEEFEYTDSLEDDVVEVMNSSVDEAKKAAEKSNLGGFVLHEGRVYMKGEDAQMLFENKIQKEDFDGTLYIRNRIKNKAP
eukprot:CAMPEP_0117506954 /NCGR_PEP_ID=MMETSP0784-20121206/26177_1 /TAXON_ID=39447 /ORGANISM="" /LENGTH=743 /DNA_ID=CAMNT_0005302449 /DNA_START=95 /DNA_END=2323 /DNA_ORIENTATION=-